MLLSVALHANRCFFLFRDRTSDRQTQQKERRLVGVLLFVALPIGRWLSMLVT